MTGIRGKGDEKFGTHGTMVRIVKTLYDLGAELDPENPPSACRSVITTRSKASQSSYAIFESDVDAKSRASVAIALLLYSTSLPVRKQLVHPSAKNI